MAAIGDIIERTDPKNDGLDRLRLAAVMGQNWVCEPLDTFTANFAVSAGDLAKEYGEVSEPPKENDEEALLLERDRQTTRAALADLGHWR